MVELIGDICVPSELRIPAIATASLPAAPITGTLVYDSTTNELKVWTGAGYEVVTSV